MTEPARLHPVNRRSVDALTLDASVADASRAIQVDVLHAEVLGWPAVLDSLRRHLAVLEDAFDATTAKFATQRAEGAWITGTDYGDSAPVAMLALAELIAAGPEEALCERAMTLHARALPMVARITTPRAQATLVLSCGAVARSSAATGFPSGRGAMLAPEAEALMRRLATGLHATFLWAAGAGWPWLEPTIGRESALIPRALIVAGEQLGAPVMRNIGLQVFDWLLENQTASAGHLTLIGDAGWPRNGDRPSFDQLPSDATAVLLAAEAALRATGAPRYRLAMERAYGWFLGQNDRRRKLANPSRGACADRLTAGGPSPSDGPEATLAWLIAAEHIRALRSGTGADSESPVEQPAARTGGMSNVRSRTVRPGPASVGSLGHPRPGSTASPR